MLICIEFFDNYFLYTAPLVYTTTKIVIVEKYANRKNAIYMKDKASNR